MIDPVTGLPLPQIQYSANAPTAPNGMAEFYPVRFFGTINKNERLSPNTTVVKIYFTGDSVNGVCYYLREVSVSFEEYEEIRDNSGKFYPNLGFQTLSSTGNTVLNNQFTDKTGCECAPFRVF